ncbi:MAG: response regulator [Candidatus Obscuribacterales bacterium]|nr:response regulator [Steroidobacteraceae bacterium]
MRILIVDDEALARAYLAEQLATVHGMEVVGQAANGFEAVKLVDELAPDLVLLDIQMPKLSGFEVLELLGERAPAVVFVTAYDEFALKAFEVHAVDYLLKPVEPARLQAALDRAITRVQTKNPQLSAQALLTATRPPGTRVDRILIREEARVLVLPVDRLDYIEAQDDYLWFNSEGKRHRKQQTMADLESQLDPARFVRVHRSYLLNIDRLSRLELYSKDSWLAILTSGAHLPVSRAGHSRLKELIR